MTIGLSIVTMEGVLYKDGNGELSNFRRFADRSHVHQLVDTMLAEITEWFANEETHVAMDSTGLPPCQNK